MKSVPVIIILTLCTPIQSYISPINVVQNIGLYSTPMGFIFNYYTENMIVFPKSTSTYPYRIRVWTTNATLHHPVLVVVRQERQVLSWQVPFVVETSRQERQLQFANTSRTLCHNDMDMIQKYMTDVSQQFIVVLSTYSKEAIQVFVEVEEEADFYIKDGISYSLTVSPSQTRYVYYRFKEKSDIVIVEIESEDDVCLTVSVQDTNCPVFDLDKDITYQGNYQTVNRKGALTVTKRKFPFGFFLVFVAKADNFACSQENSILPMLRYTVINYENRTSVVNFTIEQSINNKDYLRASLITIVALSIFCLTSIIMVCAFSYWGTMAKIRRISIVQVDAELFDEINPISRVEIDVFLQKDELHVKNLAKYPLKDKRRSFNYLWHVMSIALFYSIPVVQLVITYQRIVNQTGNQDMCYYNFRCAHPALGLSDFNHIFSNISYILVGTLFLLVIVHRHATMPIQFERGIPVHYGLFYAMGVALLIEGVLSACYHICPSQSNYQFDTSFMYVMEVLCMVKLYQNRHADINATAYATFTVLGVAIFLAMVGILNGSLAVWIGFVVVYSLLCVYISFKIYFLSFILEGLNRFKVDFSEKGFKAEVFAPIKRGRFLILLVANIINFTMLVTGLRLYDTGVTDFGTFLLGLLMGNALLHAIFYTCMKVVNHESICMEATVYGILGVVTWATATVFFLDYSVLWTVTPAESRQKNQDCILLDFYDKHDIWHLLSAPALYFSFMFLLSLDDDLISKNQSEIPVF